MQALFKTLMNKAHDEAFKAHAEKCAKTGQDPFMPYAGSLDEVFEKFGELLVRECCDIFVELRTRPADLAVLDVKKHFGVEE